MIDGVTNADALPVLERAVQFAGARHRIIAGNIANIDTPEYRMVDVSVDDFREQLTAAIDDRRARHGGTGGPLEMDSSRQVDVRPNGLDLHPVYKDANLLYHDGNDRDPERLMQDLVENFLAYRTAAELVRNQFDIINTAIRERI